MKWILPVLIAISTMAPPLAQAQETYTHATNHSPFDGQYVSIYNGYGTNNTFSEALTFDDVTYNDAYFLGFGYGRPLFWLRPGWQIDGELIGVVHEQNDDIFYEGDIGFLLRWTTPPWHNWVKSSIAGGVGLSYASKVPPLERELHPNDESARFLSALFVEAEAEVTRNWFGVLRLHHRSGAFGLFSDVDAGSNHVTVGIRRRF